VFLAALRRRPPLVMHTTTGSQILKSAKLDHSLANTPETRDVVKIVEVIVPKPTKMETFYLRPPKQVALAAPKPKLSGQSLDQPARSPDASPSAEVTQQFSRSAKFALGGAIIGTALVALIVPPVGAALASEEAAAAGAVGGVAATEAAMSETGAQFMAALTRSSEALMEVIPEEVTASNSHLRAMANLRNFYSVERVAALPEKAISSWKQVGSSIWRKVVQAHTIDQEVARGFDYVPL